MILVVLIVLAYQTTNPLPILMVMMMSMMRIMTLETAKGNETTISRKMTLVSTQLCDKLDEFC